MTRHWHSRRLHRFAQILVVVASIVIVLQVARYFFR